MDDFQRTLNSSEQFRTFVFDSFSRRLASVIQRIEAVAFTPIDTRLDCYVARQDIGDRRRIVTPNS